MKREDFIFDHMDDEYEDYWFKVVGDTKDELTKKYMEMCMVSVPRSSIPIRSRLLALSASSRSTTMSLCQTTQS